MSSPPLFKNFGKSLKDLIEKKFDFSREVKIKTATTSGVVFETSSRSANKQATDFAGQVKTTYKRADFGTFELDVDTEGKYKASAENDQLYKGLVLKISRDHEPNLVVDGAYRHEYFSTTGAVKLGKNTLVEATTAVGFEGLSVGGQVEYDINGQQISDFNAGTEYTQPDYTVSVKTSNSADKLALSYIHNINPDVTVGGQFEYHVSSVSALNSLLTAVGSYAVDRDTTVKAKFDSLGKFTAALEQRLFNPKLKYGLAAEFNARHHTVVPEKFGVSVTLGEN